MRLVNLTSCWRSVVLLSFLLTAAISSKAQLWLELSRDPHADHELVKSLAEAWFEEHGTGMGTGYSLYQQWEYEQLFYQHIPGYGQPAPVIAQKSQKTSRPEMKALRESLLLMVLKPSGQN